MKRTVIGWIVGVVAATSLVAAQGAQTAQSAATTTPNDPQQKTADVSLTGCVIQGSSPTVYILDNARLKSDDANEKAKIFVLVNQVEDLDLKGHINHEVTVTGVAEAKTPPVPPAGQKVAEKDLPRFTAKALVMVADRCTTGAR